MTKLLNVSTKRHIYFVTLIGLGFLWTGVAYIIQAYRLLGVLDAGTVNLLVCGVYYVCQALGIGAVGLLFAKRATLAGGRLLPLYATIITLASTAISLYSSSLALIIASGTLLNIAIGVLSAAFLTRLTTDIPQQRRGLVFGSAYAFGSIGTWLLSLPMGGRFLWHKTSIFAIAALAALSLLLVYKLPLPAKIDKSIGHMSGKFDKKFILHAIVVLFLLSMVNTLGFSFPLKGAVNSVYIEFTRAFYGVGLITAGILNDRSRRWGALCCVAALAFPFAALSLGNNVAGETAMWMIAYLFMGFWSVYRIIVFSDISGKSGNLLFAVFGLLAGRLGEAAGTLGSALFTGLPLVVITAAVFVLVILLFSLLYQKLYNPPISPEEAEKRLMIEYTSRFGMSAREQEIFSFIIQGMSNTEIANALYITDSTVKFHVGNIFKKTGFKSRLDLIAHYRLGNMTDIN